jgi:uncharacterized repeat protein (TIGR01451 family)
MSPKPIVRYALGLVLATMAWSQATAQVPFTCEDQFFLTFTDNNSTSLNEVFIDPQTNAVSFQSINSNLQFSVNAAGYRSVDNFIYCLDPENRRLLRLDATGQTEVLATLPLDNFTSYFAGDVTPDGKFLVLIGTVSFSSGVSYASELVKVNLENPNYPITTIPMNTGAQILDIAFHPVTEVLYGYDSNGQELVRINIDNGVVDAPFPMQQAPVTTGALFFDAYGNLFAYGSTSVFGDQNRFFEINPETGAATLLISGQRASSSDGCSCPYTVELRKTVDPETAAPCSDVEYTFEFVNTSRRPHLGMRFEDVLPPGFSFVSVKTNPLGGTVMSQAGDNFFLIENFSLPEGTYKVTIVVNTGNIAPGVYANQAVLYNLPASLGGKRISDNPRTLFRDDSTRINIVGLPLEEVDVPRALCNNEPEIVLDGGLYAGGLANQVDYLWQDGSTGRTFTVDMPGNYELKLYFGCDSTTVRFSVEPSFIEVTLAQSSYTVPLGDSIRLAATATNTGQVTNYSWDNTDESSPVSCRTCPNTSARPLNDQELTVTVTNERGCTDTAQARVTVLKDRNVFFPNVFSPDSGDDNSFFYGFGAPFTITNYLTVFTRWGEKVFESRGNLLNDPLVGWDGMHKGQTMQPGVFVWMAEVEFLDGTKAFYSGDVTLVR